jgi:hypothetical protein
MKLGNLLVVASLLVGTATFAQGDEVQGEERECLRMRKIANDAMAVQNYKEATAYFVKGEAICDDFGKDNYDRLIACAQEVTLANPEGDIYKAYVDTVLWAWEQAEANGYYNEIDDITRGYYYLQAATPDYANADKYLSRGIEKQGMDMNEQFIPVYFFNIYTLWYIEQDADAKSGLKQRLIKEYFSLSKLVAAANYAPSTQESLTQYLGQVIASCDDLLPEIPAFMGALPEDDESKKTALLDMARLLDANGCTESDEFSDVVDALYEIDNQDTEVIEMKIKKAKTLSERVEAYKTLLLNAENDQDRNRYAYSIAYEYFKAGSYQTAYGKATGVTGEYRGQALEIMGKSVGATAMSCGESTFERKCNYIYAVQLLEKAQAAGVGGLGGTIAKYNASAPDSNDCFDNGNPSSVTLSCWSISVNPCN